MRSGAIVIAFALAVASGVAGFLYCGAPPAYAVTNTAAAAIALALAAALNRLPIARNRLAALCACPALVAATLIVGPEIDGVQRWLPFGPIRLHAAALLGPAFAVALQDRDDLWGATACVILAGMIAIQPDMGTAIALCVATALSLWPTLRLSRLIAFVSAIAALCLTAVRPDPLAPVPFVEGVLQDMAGTGGVSGWLLAGLMAAALLAAIVAPSLKAGDRRTGGLAITGWYFGLVVASLIGSYPTPLIGYGAAPIIGYGIAIGMLGRKHQPNHEVSRTVI
jgi:cell division protein FtsW (lipid II flippase)